MSLYCDIRKKFGKFQLQISFEAEDETVALMGASGCGKSMTLRCIAGIEKPDAGKIILNGTTVFDSEKHINLPPQKRKTGYLFQDYALFPNMTVEKNIITVMPKEKRNQIVSIIDSFHLNGLENHYPSQLSGGQKQRCALARMLVSEPEVILLDEPFSALDSYLRWQMEQEMTSVIQKFKKTVLFVSHDRDEVYRISNRVVVIQAGKSEEIRSKQDLYQRPTTYADALLTGCKNICKARKNAAGEIEVEDLGFHIKENRDWPEVSYVGFRAKRILPAYLLEDGREAIVLPYTCVQLTESVFTMIMMVQPKGAQGLIRWELAKELYQDLKKHEKLLAIPKDEIMILTE